MMPGWFALALVALGLCLVVLSFVGMLERFDRLLRIAVPALLAAAIAMVPIYLLSLGAPS